MAAALDSLVAGLVADRPWPITTSTGKSGSRCRWPPTGAFGRPPYFDAGGGEIWMIPRSVPARDAEGIFAIVTTDLPVDAPGR